MVFIYSKSNIYERYNELKRMDIVKTSLNYKFPSNATFSRFKYFSLFKPKFEQI